MAPRDEAGDIVTEPARRRQTSSATRRQVMSPNVPGRSSHDSHPFRAVERFARPSLPLCLLSLFAAVSATAPRVLRARRNPLQSGDSDTPIFASAVMAVIAPGTILGDSRSSASTRRTGPHPGSPYRHLPRPLMPKTSGALALRAYTADRARREMTFSRRSTTTSGQR